MEEEKIGREYTIIVQVVNNKVYIATENSSGTSYIIDKDAISVEDAVRQYIEDYVE